jgi:ribosomal-protein-alanine N-acetyltransferase
MKGPGGFRIQAMVDADLDTVADLEGRTFPSPWTRDAFRHELHHNPFARSYVVRNAEGGLAGYACVWMLEGELVINNVNVAPEHRRRGLGHRILCHLLQVGRQAGCSSAVLEVRPSNRAARELYHALGFRPLGRRPRYYQDGEDALILGRSL